MQITIADIKLQANEDYTLPTEEVAKFYGVTASTIRKHLQNHSDELIENQHYIMGINKFKKSVTYWTLEGVYMLGFFIKSERAKKYRKAVAELLKEIKQGNLQIKPQQNLFGEVDKQMVEELIKRSDVVRGYQGQIAKLENELAKKQSEIINLKNKIEHQHMQTLELSAIKMFLEQVDKIKSDLDLITAVLSSEPKPIPGGHNISWGKTIFPANPIKNRLVKEIKEAINKNSKCPF